VLKSFLRFVTLTWLTMIGGAMAMAGVAKLLLQSNAKPETEEIDMVSIFTGTDLVSTAEPFYGGRVLSMFAGTQLDLRKATPAPTGIEIEVTAICSGVLIVVPEGWRVRFSLRNISSGISDATRTTADPDVPTVNVTGVVAFSGLKTATRPMVEVVH
jgi:hypothetical protein